MTSQFNKIIMAAMVAATLTGCASPSLPSSTLVPPAIDDSGQYVYRIGTGDTLSVFVWGNPDLTGDYQVRPDGKISTALTDSVQAVGTTSSELEVALAEELAKFIKNPKITVMVKSASGYMGERVKVLGEGTQPSSFAYRKGLTVLDLMIAVGGLNVYADGNDAKLFRMVNGKMESYPLRLEDLMEDADLTANVDLMPGDVIRIPEAWF